jgi:hypothetical protein
MAKVSNTELRGNAIDRQIGLLELLKRRESWPPKLVEISYRAMW